MTDFGGSDLRRTVIDRNAFNRNSGNSGDIIIGYDATGQPVKQKHGISPFISKRDSSWETSPPTNQSQSQTLSQNSKGFYLPPPSVAQTSKSQSTPLANHWNQQLTGYRQHQEYHRPT